MGIPRIFQWIVRKYPTTFSKGINSDIIYDYLCYDMNGIIHPCVRQSITENGCFVQKHVLDTIKNKTLEIANFMKPQKGIIICIDGVAPISKMFQQRLRRYKSIMDKKIEMDIYKKYDVEYPYIWDTNAITPGTNFMKILDEYFKTNILPELEKLYPYCIIHFSGSNKYGEGEHKIMEFIRGLSKNKPHENIIIHGLDADLIFLSIGLDRNNVFLFREQEDNIGILSINELKDNLFVEIQTKCSVPLDQSLVEKDFMVISYFIGNDFLPSIFSTDVFQIEDILKVYCEILEQEKKNLVFQIGNHFSIDWLILSKLSEKINSIEFALIKKRVKKYISIRDYDDKFPNMLLEEIFHKKLRKREDYLNMMEPGWRERFYDHYFHFSPSDWDKKNPMILNYLEGLQWNLNYYLSGIKNWLWSYQYHAAPFFGDIFHYISKKGIRKLIQSSRNIRIPTRIPSDIEQLLIVFPPQSHHLIPENKRKLTKYPEILKYYNNDIELDYFYKIRDWEYKPILPDIDINMIYKIVMENK